MLGAYEHESGAAISIKKFDIPRGNYSELAMDELKGYPALEKALSGEGCTKFNEESWYCKVDRDEWQRTSYFISAKQMGGSAPLFKINGKYYEIGFMTP